MTLYKHQDILRCIWGMCRSWSLLLGAEGFNIAPRYNISHVGACFEFFKFGKQLIADGGVVLLYPCRRIDTGVIANFIAVLNIGASLFFTWVCRCAGVGAGSGVVWTVSDVLSIARLMQKFSTSKIFAYTFVIAMLLWLRHGSLRRELTNHNPIITQPKRHASIIIIIVASLMDSPTCCVYLSISVPTR